MKFDLILYNLIVVPLLWLLFHAGGLVNAKIRRGIRGRRHLFRDLEERERSLRSSVRCWFHASSLGEFEQAKPIIAEIKRLYPHVEIIATFFSPSGFENSKQYKAASIISYVPFDSLRAVRRFIDIIKPTAAIMVRYDIWPNMIHALHARHIPVMIANATMKPDSLRMLPLFRSFHRSLYDRFAKILTVSDNDADAFRKFGTTQTHIEAIGDTRFDQVMTRSIDARQRHLLSDEVIGGRTVFVVGQSWGEDDDVIIPVIHKLHQRGEPLLTIIVPHEPTVEHLEALEDKLHGVIPSKRFSEMSTYRREPVILIDSIGVLVALYQYAQFVYVGGSFRQGIHNILEPAVFGVPVIYGPKHTNSQEAVELARRSGGFVVTDSRSLHRTVRTLLHDPHARSAAGEISVAFVQHNCGATQRILSHLHPLLQQ